MKILAIVPWFIEIQNVHGSFPWRLLPPPLLQSQFWLPTAASRQTNIRPKASAEEEDQVEHSLDNSFWIQELGNFCLILWIFYINIFILKVLNILTGKNDDPSTINVQSAGRFESCSVWIAVHTSRSHIARIPRESCNLHIRSRLFKLVWWRRLHCIIASVV